MGRPSRTTLIVGAAIGFAAAGGVAVASGSPPFEDGAEQVALAELATVDQARAQAAALESTGGGTVISSELEEEDGSVVWEVEVRLDDGSVHEVEIDGGDARVLGTEPEEPDDDADEGDDDQGDDRGDDRGDDQGDDDVAEQAVLAELATVDRAGAQAAALESTGGGTVISSELEEEDGSVVWEVEVRLDDGSVHEVEIDGGDARVLGTEPDEPGSGP